MAVHLDGEDLQLSGDPECPEKVRKDYMLPTDVALTLSKSRD